MRFEGSAALKLDFGGVTTTAVGQSRPAQLRLAPARGLQGPDKYKVLEHRRRQAQIQARRLLEVIDEAR